MTRTIEVGRDLSSFLLGEIASFPGEGILVHAGHFVLDTSTGGLLCDHLSSGFEDVHGLVRDFLRFTSATWRMGCDLAVRSSGVGHPVSLMVLVNDWQFVAGSGSNKRSRERDAERKRRAYYEGVPELPHFHSCVMAEHGLLEDRIYRSKDERWLFSESELRQGLAKMISLFFRDGTAEIRGLSREFTSTGDLIVKVRSELYSESCLLYCGATNCSGEIVALLKLLWDRGIRLFVNIYPIQCLGPVSAGTEMARQIFSLGGMKIVNVAFPLGDLGANPRAVVDIV